MAGNISEKSLSLIKKMQQNELNESIIYEKIAKFAKGDENKKTLLRLAKEEKAHCEIWEKYTNESLKPNKLKIFKYVFIAWLLGFTFAVKLMEKGEANAQGNAIEISSPSWSITTSS